jgi:hypothetical protein
MQWFYCYSFPYPRYVDIVWSHYVMNDRPSVACVISKVELQGHPYVTFRIVLQVLFLSLSEWQECTSICMRQRPYGWLLLTNDPLQKSKKMVRSYVGMYPKQNFFDSVSYAFPREKWWNRRDFNFSANIKTFLAEIVWKYVVSCCLKYVSVCCITSLQKQALQGAELRANCVRNA